MTNNNNLKRRSVENRTFASRQLVRIYKRDRGICQLCFRFVLRCDASRDHIIEITQSVDAETLRDDSNVRLAHIDCNNRRSNSSTNHDAKPKRRKRRRRGSSATNLNYKIGDYFNGLHLE